MGVAEHNPVTVLPRSVGVVLAAGEGRRFGRAKGLVRGRDGVAWVELACRVLLGGGCSEVVVVVGARGEEVRQLVPPGARCVVATDWATGISASLRAGLAAAARTSADVAVVTLVDLPGLRPEAVRRVLDAATDPAAARSAAVRSAEPGAAQSAAVRPADPAVTDPPAGARSTAVRSADPGAARSGAVWSAHPAAVRSAPPGVVRGALVRAVYDGAPGHPVLLGRAHWGPVAAAVHGDTGAGPYLRAHGAAVVDCTDLGGGDDVDRASV